MTLAVDALSAKRTSGGFAQFGHRPLLRLVLLPQPEHFVYGLSALRLLSAFASSADEQDRQSVDVIWQGFPQDAHG
jgi:hypothetical protein